MDKGLLVLLFVFIGIPAIAFGYLYTFRKRKEANRQAILEKDFPHEWLLVIQRNIPVFERLPFDLKRKLEKSIQLFLGKTQYEGCGGLEIDDEIRVTIAAQACLITLGHSRQLYPHLKSILVYPSSFRGGEKGIFGTDPDQQTIRLGESWGTGTVILAWDSSRRGALNDFDGQNVVIHEFAHQLDQEDGNSDGTPLLAERSGYVAWSKVMADEYQNQVRKALKGKRSVIDHYGATNPAEFFATATEAFFEKPEQLYRKRPEVYRILKSYFRLSPIDW